jgi:hypothetical protein
MVKGALAHNEDEERLGAVGADDQTLLDVCGLGWPGYEVAAPQASEINPGIGAFHIRHDVPTLDDQDEVPREEKEGPVTERVGVDPDGPVLGDSKFAPDNGQVDVRALLGGRFCFGIEVSLGDLFDLWTDLFRREEDLGAGDMLPGGLRVGDKPAFTSH